MKIDRTFFEDKWIHSKVNPTIWIISSADYQYELIVPNLDGKPSPDSIDYLVEILENIEQIEADAQKYIKIHLSMQSKFSLEGIEILSNPDRNNSTAILHFRCDEDSNLFIEIGLNEFRILSLLLHY
jgi:hypothetical protein